MMEFLSQYGLFLAKTLTLVIGILVTFGVLMALAMKAKSKAQEGTLVIASVNEKLDEIRSYLQSETLPKPALKKWLKEQKEQEKKEKKSLKAKNIEPTKGRLFVVRFDGDVRASEVVSLREVISAILEIAIDTDEVLIVLESAGGFVHSYGLAASQIQRLRQRKLIVTVAIDKVAASGGYLMACVANHIIAAPFAIVGSIGVVAQLPNFHRFLDKHNIDFELHTAGEYKRTLTLFGENTDKARQKFQEEIDETHHLFKDFININRPIVNVDEVATGEHWHAVQAIKLNLVDEVLTSDDFILMKAKQSNVYEISYEIKQKLSEKISGGIFQSLEKYLVKWIAKSQPALLR